MKSSRAKSKSPPPEPRDNTTSPPIAIGPLRTWPAAIFVFSLAVAVRAIYFFQYHGSPLRDYYVLDHLYYLEWARQIAAGDHGQEVFEQGPLYPYLLALALRTLGERIPLILAGQMLLGALAVVLAYLSARRLFDPRTALVGGILTALYGPMIFYECMVMKSFLSPVLTIAVLYTGLRWADSGRIGWLALQGLAIGLACLERESHALLWLPAIAWVWSVGARQEKTPAWRLARMGLLTAALGICLIPSAVRNYRVGGEWVLVTAGGGEVFYMAHGPDANGFYRAPDFVKPNPFVEHQDFRREAERRTGQTLTRGESSRFWFGEAWRSVVADPGKALWLTGKKGVILLNDFEVNDSENYGVTRRVVGILYLLPSFGWISVLGVAGWVACCRQGQRNLLLLGLAGAHIASVLLTYNFGRFRLGLTPLWCLLAAYGIVWLIDLWRKGDQTSRRRALAYAAVALLATIVVFLPPPGSEEMTYTIDDQVLLGELAGRAGQFDRAEFYYRQALVMMRQHEERFPADKGDQEALLAIQFGDDLLQRGELQRALLYYRHALERPNADQERELLLRHWVGVLRTYRQVDQRSEALPDPQAEIEAVVAQLQRLNPAEPSYWAIATQWADQEAEVLRLRQGLTAACDKTAAENTAWCSMGRAFLAKAEDQREEMRRQANLALSQWPEHPWRAELEALLAEPAP